MRKTLKKYLIPHKDNEGRPHLLRERAVLVLAGFIILVFGLATLETVIITRTDLLAAIFPSLLVDLTNKDRVNAGLPNLKLNPALARSAQMKANDMAAKSYFAHNSPDGKTPWYWFSQSGYNFLYAGENLAVNFSESADINQAWLASPTHRANIMKTEFTEIGIALATGYYEGHLTTFVVQHFGRPVPSFGPALATAPPPAPAPVPTPAPAPTPVFVTPTPTRPQAVSGAEEGINIPEVKKIKETETFIAVRNASIPEAEAQTQAQTKETPSGTALGQSGYASWFEELLLSPRRTLGFIYLLLAAIIFIVLILTVGIEIGRHHPRHILYGILLLVLIAALFYLYRTVIFQEVLVL